MKKHIAILGGGNSSEYEISIKSAEQIINYIDRKKYVPYAVTVKDMEWVAITESGSVKTVDLNDFSIKVKGEKIRFEYAFIIIHGDPGENGKIQAYLDLQKIPYNTSGVLFSALSFNKYACKMYLRNFGVITAEAVLISKMHTFSTEKIIETVGLPCFVKPNNGGSSFGVSRVNHPEDIKEAVDLAFNEDQEVMIESYIKGTELSCGLLKTKEEEIIFPVTEIITKNDFFDYEAKYKEGFSEEITPAAVSDKVQKRCQTIASEIYDHLHCRGLVRADFILRGNQLYFLELNSVPGMSRESIIPKQIRTMGFKLEDIIDKVITDTLIK